MMSVVFPIFVREKDSGRLFICESVYKLQYHVERIDLENNEYDAWDSKGVLVKMSVQEPVWVRLQSAGSDDQGLQNAIRAHASQRGLNIDESLLNGGEYPELAKKFLQD